MKSLKYKKYENSIPLGFIPAKTGRELHRIYNRIIGKLVVMGNNPKPWLLKKHKD